MQNSRAIAAYWVATYRGELDEAELRVFDIVLRDTDVEDAVAAIDDVAAAGGYPPTPQRIAELAEPHRKERARLRLEHEALPHPNRPMSFGDWLKNVATEDEKRIVAKVSPGLHAKFGGDLADLDAL